MLTSSWPLPGDAEAPDGRMRELPNSNTSAAPEASMVDAGATGVELEVDVCELLGHRHGHGSECTRGAHRRRGGR